MKYQLVDRQACFYLLCFVALCFLLVSVKDACITCQSELALCDHCVMASNLLRQRILDSKLTSSSPRVSVAAPRGAVGYHKVCSQRPSGYRTLISCRALVLSVANPESEGYKDDDDYPLEVPTSFELMQRPDKQKPLVRVRLSVHYRVHSRQMLCIGGSQIPLGWSFLSIAKVPMTWNSGDIWTCEVELQAGQRIEYKYVILEEQDWTKLENEDAQGLVEITYRTGSEPGKPPDVQVIQKQMAIVAWQPGPNRVLQVPSETELSELKVGEAIERIPARPNQRIPYTITTKRPPPLKPDPFEGTWEVLTTDEEGRPFLDRHDVWGWVPNPGNRPSNLKGFSFGQQ